MEYKAKRQWPDSTWQTDMPFPDDVIAKGEWRGKMTHVGMWHILTGYRALAVEQTDEGIDTSHYEPFQTTAIIHGMRSLLKPKESGHELEGYVSIKGKRHRAFTSSSLFLVDGKLIDVAILYVCKHAKKERN